MYITKTTTKKRRGHGFDGLVYRRAWREEGRNKRRNVQIIL